MRKHPLLALVTATSISLSPAAAFGAALPTHHRSSVATHRVSHARAASSMTTPIASSFAEDAIFVADPVVTAPVRHHATRREGRTEPSRRSPLRLGAQAFACGAGSQVPYRTRRSART